MTWEDVSVQLVDTPPSPTARSSRTCRTSSVPPTPSSFASTAPATTPRRNAHGAATVPAASTWFGTGSGFVDDDFSKVQISSLLVVTRGSDPDADERLALYREMNPPAIPVLKVEFDDPATLTPLRQAVYVRPAGGDAAVTRRLPANRRTGRHHSRCRSARPWKPWRSAYTRTWRTNLKFAKVWGSGLHDGQSVGRDHVLQDKDLVELHTG